MPSPTPETVIRPSLAGPILVAGFAVAVVVWCMWFVAPLPWVGASEPFALGMCGVLWLAAASICFRSAGFRPSLPVGIGAGLVTAAVCLIPLLSKLRPAGPDALPLAHPLPTDAWKIVLLFFGAGAAFGVIAALEARLQTRTPPAEPPSQAAQRWLARFAIVAALAVAPLLFFGGLVTSTNSGIAVPDWPTTFGAQMFFYPMGSETNPDVYLEHTHRLFGTLVGLTTLVLLVWTSVRERWTWPTKVVLAAFVLVCIQGVLGGLRVLHNDRLMAMLHGILAQPVFALIVALAAYLTPTFQQYSTNTGTDPKAARRLKKFATALLNALILQLIFGALARHFRTGNHAVWMHAAFSIIIVGLAANAGFAAMALPKSSPNKGVITLRRVGLALVVVVLLQFVLGWAAFSMRGPDIKAATAVEALIRTAHQANGALLLAATALAFVWARWLFRTSKPG